MDNQRGETGVDCRRDYFMVRYFASVFSAGLSLSLHGFVI